MKSASLLLFLIFFSSQFLFSQGDSASMYYTPANVLRFADYLRAQEDYLSAANEYQRYLFSTPQSNDSISLLIGKCYLFAGRNDLAKNHFRGFSADERHHEYATAARLWLSYAYFEEQQYDSCLSILQTSHDDSVAGTIPEQEQLLFTAAASAQTKGMHLSPIANNGDSSSSLMKLRELLHERELHYPDKSPFVAGALSAVVPGLGKIYGGRTVDGLFSFLSVALTGWQAYDGFSKDGAKSVKGWIVGGLGMSFYLGNIYGSALNIELQNEMKQAQFRNDLHALVKASFNL